MKYIRFVFLLVLVLMVVPAHAQTGPEAEATESEALFSPLILEDGDVRVEALSDAIQARLYVFYGSEGDAVTVSMTQIDDDLDPFLVLLGAAGEVIATDDDSGRVSLSAQITDAKLPMDGMYFVMATSYQYVDDILDVETDQEDLDYELAISGVTMPGDVTDETEFMYYGGTLVDGERMEGDSTPEEPVFYYKLEGRAGEVVDLRLESDEFDTILHVFSPSGERIAVNDDAEGTTDSAITGLELPEDGMYLVFATDVFFYNAGVDTPGDESIFSYEGGTFTIIMNGAEGEPA